MKKKFKSIKYCNIKLIKKREIKKVFNINNKTRFSFFSNKCSPAIESKNYLNHPQNFPTTWL
jgi:hypothetical protein